MKKFYKIIGVDEMGLHSLTLNINNHLCTTNQPKLFRSFRNAEEFIKEHQSEFIHKLYIVEV